MALLLSTILLAQTSGEKITETLLGFLPILVFFGILIFLFRRQTNSPAAKLVREERARHMQHMQKMEEFVERIAKALERNQ